MQLLYTGAPKHWAVQTDPAQSLGGYVSSSLIPNGGLNNIFPAIDKDDIKNNLIETRLIVWKTSLAVTGVTIWTVKGALASYQIAVVTPAMVGTDPFFEQLANGNSIPYQATLVSAEGQGNAINVGAVDSGKYIGIWIQRTLDLTGFTELDGKPGIETLTTDQLEQLILNQSTDGDNSQLIIDWA